MVFLVSSFGDVYPMLRLIAQIGGICYSIFSTVSEWQFGHLPLPPQSTQNF
jgi:hypothetical protein